MRIALAVIVLLVVGSCGLVLFSRVRHYRIDIAPNQNAYDGASRFPPVNYLSRANYAPEGRPLLRWLWAWHAAMAIVVVIALWLIFSSL